MLPQWFNLPFRHCSLQVVWVSPMRSRNQSLPGAAVKTRKPQKPQIASQWPFSALSSQSWPRDESEEAARFSTIGLPEHNGQRGP
jgi:hypothetical protein